MKAMKRLTIASAMTILLSACGSGAGSVPTINGPKIPDTVGAGSESGNDQASIAIQAPGSQTSGTSSTNTNQMGAGANSTTSTSSATSTGTTAGSNTGTNAEQNGETSSETTNNSGNTQTSYPEWSAGVAYNQGDRVSFEGQVYEAGWWTQGSAPSESGEWGVWQLASGNTSEGSNTDGNGAENNPENNTQTNPESNAEPIELPELNAGIYDGYNKVYKQDSGKALVSYFVEWGVYGRNYHVQDIPAANLTHMLYGFLAICSDNPQAGGGAQQAIAAECANKVDYEVTIIDKFAALEKTYPGDTWSDNVYGEHYNGNFGQMKKLKAQYPNLVMLPSVGGWTLSTPFFEMANDPAKRAVFVDSVIRFVKKYDFFDGIDIDWEYPGVAGADSGLASASDSAAYTALMRDMRAAFDELSLETGRAYQITSAVGAGPSHIAAVDYTNAHSYMDYIFMMTYDYAGAWSNITGHHTPLYSNNEVNEGFYAAAAVETMLQKGVPSNKIVLGAAMYGRGWTGVSNSNDYAQGLYPLFGQATGPGKGTWEAGVYDYKDLFENYIGEENQGINGFTVMYDEVAEAPYLWNASSGEFITYESPRSVQAKADFINQYNLGGFLSWEIDADNGLILNAMNEGVGNTEIQ